MTALGAEGCGIAFGHACGVRVQRVHKVQRVQRGWYRRFAAMSFIAACRRQRCQRQRKPYNRACGALEMHPYPRLRRYFHLKVKRLTTFCASLTLLQNVFAVHPGGGSLLYSQLLNS